MTTGELTESPYNDTLGFCFPYSAYTYDNDAMPATPEIGYPSCRDLPPAGGDPMSTPHGETADAFDCYSSARTSALPKHSLGHAKLNLRVVASRPGEVTYRHVML